MAGQGVCPKCQLPLRRYRAGAVVAVGCLQCGGVLLSPAALTALRQTPEAAFVLEDAFADQLPLPLVALEMPCPLCGGAMAPSYLPEAPSMTVERCPQCGSVWLDDGELAKLGQVLQRTAPSPAVSPANAESAVPVAESVRVYCAHCGRENFADATECWACGEPLVPEPPPLPGLAQRLAEWATMLIGGAGALLFGTFIARPQGERWAALGMALMLCGLAGLALLRRVWRRPKRSGIFPGFSE